MTIYAIAFIGVLFVGGLLAFVAMQARRLKHVTSLLEDALGSNGAGIVFFDENDRLKRTNDLACVHLPFLEVEKKLTLSQFLNYLFDYAADVEDDLRNALTYSVDDDEGSGFREIIRSEAGVLCLAEARKTEDGRALVILHDLSRLETQFRQIYALHKINSDLSQAIEATTCAVLITNPKSSPHSVIFLNDACCRILKMQKSDVIGLSLDSFFNRLGPFDGHDQVHDGFRNSEPCHKEIKISVEGETRWFDLRLTPVFDSSGALDLFIAVFTDMTALKLREAEFFKAQKLDALGRLAAGVAHDFNNVLSIIDGYSRMTVNNIDDHEKVIGNNEKIQSAARRGANLTRQMLTFSHHKIVHDVTIDLKKAVEDQRALIEPLFDANTAIDITCEGDTLYAACSSDSVAQIMLNLAINARDAMDGGGRLDVHLGVCPVTELPKVVRDKADDQEFLCLSVTDSGSGIEKHVLEQMFDPFFTTKEQGKGTGLGLSVVYGLVQEMSGHIHVESQLNKGTTFYVYIPRSHHKPVKQLAGSLTDANSIQLKGFTALVAEDEPDLRGLISEFLKSKGMTVLVAEDGDDALVVQEDYEGEIDILISDIVMPGLNGLKLAELMQALRPDIQVIYISGYPARGEMAHVELPQDALFVAKPVDYDVLCQLIFACLSEDGPDAKLDLLKMTAGHWETQKNSEAV